MPLAFGPLVAVNQELILLYWSIGSDILVRQATEGWGARVIDRLGEDLRRTFPEMTGLSGRSPKPLRRGSLSMQTAIPDCPEWGVPTSRPSMTQ
jgi:DUF1016 N-terminal domain